MSTIYSWYISRQKRLEYCYLNTWDSQACPMLASITNITLSGCWKQITQYREQLYQKVVCFSHIIKTILYLQIWSCIFALKYNLLPVKLQYSQLHFTLHFIQIHYKPLTLIPIFTIVNLTNVVPKTASHSPSSHYLCSDDTDFEEKADEMTDFLINRHYLKNIIKGALDLSLPYHPSTICVRRIILKNWSLLQARTEVTKIFSQPPVIAYKWDTNIWDMLARSKRRSTKVNNYPYTWNHSVQLR